MNCLIVSFVGILLQIAGTQVHDAPRYSVHRASMKIVVDGRAEDADWQAAPDVGSFRFPWWTQGEREPTEAKLLWDEQYLYVLFKCEDAHVWAEHTQRDSPVYRDDCVEVFTAPDPRRPNDYFNFEMNVRRAMLDQHHPEGPGVKVRQEWNSDGVQIRVTVDGTLNDDRDTDRGWILEAAIPLANFSQVAQHTPPKPGDVWHLNLNRCGGKTNQQYSQWSPSKTELPQFHAPQDFGRVIFVTKTATKVD